MIQKVSNVLLLNLESTIDAFPHSVQREYWKTYDFVINLKHNVVW